MAKTRRDRSVSFDSSRRSPLPCSLSHRKNSSTSCSSESREELREWEDARCPVCMDHPHNAVLLVCSSYGKGCRPYMCDTSYRHSNCFDQFCKSSPETPPLTSQEPTQYTPEPTPTITSDVNDSQEERNKGPVSDVDLPNMRQLHQKLLCPLCRGLIFGCTIVESARSFMNDKTRSCACETCDFNGNYTDLRKHARLEHPLVRPSEADPERQRNWRRLERQRDIADVLSTIQSSFSEIREDSLLPFDESSSWLAVFFLIRVAQPGSSTRSSSWSGTTRSQSQFRIRTRRSARLWGESYDEEAAEASRELDQLETTREVRIRNPRLRTAENDAEGSPSRASDQLETVDVRIRYPRRRAAENDAEEADADSANVDHESHGSSHTTRRRRVRRRTTRNDDQ